MKMIKFGVSVILVSLSTFAQGTFGTIAFHNRGLSGATPGTTYNAPIFQITDPASAAAQLFLVTGSGASAVYTPLTPLQTFRPAPNQQYFVAPVSVEVTGHAPGTTGLQFVVRAWQGAANYDAALTTPGALYGQSQLITVAGALGGTTAEGGIFLPPDLGGPNGLGSYTLIPEPSAVVIGTLGVAALLYRRRK